MRILHVVPSMNRGGGGPSESVPMTALAQKEAGLDVAIAFYDTGELSPFAEEAGRRGIVLHRFRGDNGFLNPLAVSLDFVRRFGEIAKGYDVVHTHVQWMFPIWWAAYTARRLGKRLVMMPRGCFERERLKISKWKKRMVGWIDRHYAKRADSVWATSEQEADAIREFAPGSKVEIYPIGLDVTRFRVSEQRGNTILFLSRISPVKGLDMLAEAWGLAVSGQRLAVSGQQLAVSGEGWKLVIAGPDDRKYTDEIKKVFAEKCAPGSYEFRGPVYGEEKFKLLSQADAFVLPTRNENWGIAVAEAMASGLPVICTKGAPWQCLEEVGAGWWTDISVEGLEAALKKLVATSREERLEMGARARRWIEENLDWRKIGSAMRLSYEHLLVAQ